MPLAILAALEFAGTGAIAGDEVPFPDDEAALLDGDKDGLADIYEYFLGTRPDCADSDRDSFADGAEVAHRSDPLIPSVSLPGNSAVALDYIPEAGGIRFAVTVFSRDGFGPETRLQFLLGTSEGESTDVRNLTREMLNVGRRFRSQDGRVMGYVSRRMPLRDMPARFSLGAKLESGDEFVLDDALLGVRGGQFFRTEITELPNDQWLGGTIFLTVSVETGGQPGFSPNEDCKQVFGRVRGPVKIILSEFCEIAMDRYCPENCGGDVGLRVICIKELFRR